MVEKWLPHKSKQTDNSFFTLVHKAIGSLSLAGMLYQMAQHPLNCPCLQRFMLAGVLRSCSNHWSLTPQVWESGTSHSAVSSHFCGLLGWQEITSRASATLCVTFGQRTEAFLQLTRWKLPKSGIWTSNSICCQSKMENRCLATVWNSPNMGKQHYVPAEYTRRWGMCRSCSTSWEHVAWMCDLQLTVVQVTFPRATGYA